MSSSLKAGLDRSGTLALFMIIMYRIPGFVSCLALCFYMVIEALLFSLDPRKPVLAGHCRYHPVHRYGVDANVIIFERIKEEIRWQDRQERH